MKQIRVLFFLVGFLCNYSKAAMVGPDMVEMHSYTKIKCNSKADIVFLIDSSSSVGEEDFIKMLSFIVSLLEDADIDSHHDVRVGLLSYSTDVTINFHLGEYKTKLDIINDIINTKYQPGSTNTADALLALRTEMFNEKNGDRLHVPNVAVVITDGISNLNADRTVTEAIRAHSGDIYVFAIGIGFTGRTPELRLMVTAPVEDSLFLVEKYDKLEYIRKALFARICEMSLLRGTMPGPTIPAKTSHKAWKKNLCDHAFDLALVINIKHKDIQRTRKFIKKLLSSFDVESKLTQLALTTGFKKKTVMFNQHLSKEDLLHYFDNDVYEKKRNYTLTDVTKQLKYTRDKIFTPTYGDREDIPDIVLIVTDDLSSSRTLLRREVKKLKSLGIHIILVAIGYKGKRKHLRYIVSEPHEENQFIMRNIRKLALLSAPIASQICNVARLLLLKTTHKDYITSLSHPTDTNQIIDEDAFDPIVEDLAMVEWNFTQLEKQQKIEGCHGRADIVFVLDSSGSVGQTNFNLTLDFVKNFSSYINLNYEGFGHRISVLSFSDHERLHIKLTDQHSLESLKAVIDNIRYVYGSTNLASALKRIRNDVLNQSFAHIETIAFIIIDGPSNLKTTETIPESRHLKEAGVTIVGIPVNMRSAHELEQVVSQPNSKFLYRVESFRQLHGLIPELVPPLCHGDDLCSSLPCESGGTCINLLSRYRCQCMPGYTGQNCQHKCNRPTDLVFLMDSSASIGETNFQFIKLFVKETVTNLNLDSCNYQIATMKYGSSAIPQFYFGDYSNLAILTNAIDRISFSYGYTNTAEAIRVARKTFFTKDRGDRAEARNVIVLITDGLDNIRSKLLFEEARQTHEQDIAIIPIGINLKENNELPSIASTPEGLFYVQRFLDMENLTETFVKYMIKSENLCKNNPCSNGGKCMVTSTSFTCECSHGWNGQLCESKCAPKSSILFAIDASGYISWEKFGKMRKIFESILASIHKIDRKVPVAIVSISAAVWVEKTMSISVTKSIGIEIFNSIHLRSETSIDVDIVTKLVSVFKDERAREYTKEMNRMVIFIGHNSTLRSLPVHNLAGSGLDLIFIGVDDTYRHSVQFKAKYPYNGISDIKNLPIEELTDHVTSIICDGKDDCSNWPCKQRGHCVDGKNSYSCICFPGYSGLQCERGCPAQADIAFLVDSSGSVGRRNFMKVQEFLSEVVSEMRLGENGSQFALSTFSTVPKTSFYLNSYSTKKDAMEGIINAYYRSGNTNTADGLKLLRNEIFTFNHGDRINAQNIAILITDGVSNVRSYATVSEAELTKDAGTHIFTVGVSLRDTSEALAITSYPPHSNTFFVPDFDHLNGIVDTLVSSICQDADMCENNPCYNDGKCIDQMNSFTCQCASGYSGSTCEKSCLTKLDLAFILDTSTSVGDVNFQRSLDFVKNITNHLEVDNGNAQLSLVTFSDYVSIWFYLKSFGRTADVFEAVDGVGHSGGATFTSEALRTLRSEIFVSNNGDRIGVPNKCIFITDGVSNILPQKTLQEAIKLKHAGIETIAIGINIDNTQEIKQIVSNENNLYLIDSYTELHSVLSSILDTLCSVANIVQSDVSSELVYSDEDEFVNNNILFKHSLQPLDVAFLLDSSGSVGSYNFSKILSFIEYFIELIYSKNNTIQYSVLSTSHPVRVFFHLREFALNDIQQTVMNIPYIPAQTDLTSSLKHLYAQVFSHKYGSRQNVTRIAILFVDGYTYEYSSALTYADRCRNNGIKLYIITIALQDVSIFVKMTRDSEQVFKLNEYEDLLDLAKKLSEIFFKSYGEK